MLLVYYRTDVSHAFLGFLFGVDDPCRIGNGPSAGTSTRRPRRWPASPASPNGALTLEPGEIRELFFDAVERPIPRPARRRRRPSAGKKGSGKQGRHTLKRQVAVVRRSKTPSPRPDGKPRPRKARIAAVSPAFPGRTHGKRIHDRTRAVCPPGVARTGDTAYLGAGLATPRRKPRGGALAPRRKAGNRRLSRRRIVVEHGIGKRRLRRIVAERDRNPRRRHALTMRNVAGLRNLTFA